VLVAALGASVAGVLVGMAVIPDPPEPQPEAPFLHVGASPITASSTSHGDAGGASDADALGANVPGKHPG
jgi:hypothetical protein